MENIKIKEYLDILPKNEIIYYYPNPGNAGDSMIACATFQLFNEAGVNYKLLNEQDYDLKDKILIYGGGGNFVSYYNSASNIIKKYHKIVKKLIILPHTISGNEDLLKDLSSNVDIITREMVSFDHVKKNNCKSNILLMDDLAFSLNVEEVLKKIPVSLIDLIVNKFHKTHKDVWCDTISLKTIIKNNRFEALQNLRKYFKSEKYSLNCFRNDIEKTYIEIPKDSRDLSEIFAYGTSNELQSFYSCYRLLKFMNKYQVINTNRLHLCIAGALLKKQVHFYSNNYYKCEAVYSFSIKNRFNNIQWMN